VTLNFEESEGHTEFAASFLQGDNAFAEPKPDEEVIAVTASHKYLDVNELSDGW